MLKVRLYKEAALNYGVCIYMQLSISEIQGLMKILKPSLQNLRKIFKKSSFIS